MQLFSVDLPRTAVALAGITLLPLLLASGPAAAQVTAEQEITQGDVTGMLEDGDSFGRSVARLGDLDGDGTLEVAVGAYLDDVNGVEDVGSVWILSLDETGMVQGQQQITSGIGGFGGTLDAGDEFGVSVGALGDIDGDNVGDLAVGARYDDEGGRNRGAVWILSLNEDGTVKAENKISHATSGVSLSNNDLFGQSVAGGDLDGDGARELAVGASGPDNGAGALWILEFDASRTVTNANRIDGGSAGITLDANDNFGFSVAALGDLDGGGNGDLAVGAFRDDDGGTNRGALWILNLNDDETVGGVQKISDTAGSFGGTLDDRDRFGAAATGLGDLNGDGVPDLATGAYLDDDGGSNRGAVWILYLNANGTVNDIRKISDTAGGFQGALEDGDQFGIAAAGLGDLDGDGIPDLLAGAFMDPEAGSATGPGAAWVLFGEQGLLPVELAAFDGVQAGRSARLRWTTASEQGNAGFRVQHLGPAADAWTQMGFVESAAPGGTTTQSNTYRFTTGTLAAGVHRFRLEQVDLDGSTHLHAPLSVEVTLQRPIQISGPYPNPVRDQATISFAVKEAAETTITLYNVLGQTVSTLYRGTPAAGAVKTAYLDASTLPNGVYVVRLRAGERTELRRLTVVR